MEKFFEPKSLVVIGVSDARLSLGRIVFQNAVRLAFSGDVFGVGSFSDARYRDRMVRSIADLPAGIDLAVVLTPAATLPQILEQCGERGIGRVVVESAGFSEFGPSRQCLETDILSTARKHGIRLMGPNCVGTINVSNRLFLPFAPIPSLPPAGAISLIAQSGGVGTHFFLRLAEEGIGIAKFASVGNKLDLDEVDFLRYLINDPKTSVIGMYLESIQRGRELFATLQASTKPVVILKSNRSHGAAEAAQSHTAALSSDDLVVDAAIRQAGALRVNTAADMIDTLKILTLPPMKGDRLAVLSRSGGHAVVTVDACLAAGFTLAEFPEAFLKSLSEVHPSRVIAKRNPLDLGEIFDYTAFAKIVERAIQLDQVDGVVFNHIYVAGTETGPTRTFLKKVSALQAQIEKPIAITLATEVAEVAASAREARLPLFAEPETAVAALQRSADWMRHRERLGKNLIAPALTDKPKPKPTDGPRGTSLIDAFDWLNQLDIPLMPFRFARDEGEARAAASDLGYPVAVKVVSEKASHKTDVGGVVLNVADELQLSRTLKKMAADLQSRLGSDRVDGFCLQPMADSGVEVIVGGRRDAQFGPVIMLGLGGVLVELIRDTVLRLAPISEAEAHDMIAELKSASIFQGYRGASKADTGGLAKLIARVSVILSQYDQISEIDLNPVVVTEQDVQVVDARISPST